MHLRGEIIAYANDVRAGVVKTPDGRKFIFTRSDWADPHEPEKGVEVRFMPDGGMALDVRPY